MSALHKSDTRDNMSIRLPLLFFFSFLLCPVASQTGQKVKEVKSGLCTSAELIGTAADCQAAAKVLGIGQDVPISIQSYSGYSPGCLQDRDGGSSLYFNTNKASTIACGVGYLPNFVCLCVDPCPIGKYQNEESSTTCKSCLPGTYSDETGQATCKNCPSGKNSATGASKCQPFCCQAKANYSKYEKNCNMIKDATADYLIQFDHLDYTCNWNCDVTTVMDMHNVSQK